MKTSIIIKNYLQIISLFIALIYSVAGNAQLTDSIQQKQLIKRIAPAPETVFAMFREAEMNPVNHPLTEAEKLKVEKAFANLPPLHQKVLQMHLYSISFMDSMPNNALTSPIGDGDSSKLFNIVFRAGILNETISEWATKKEYTSFDRSANPDIKISVEAGDMDAIQYVLLHEATHVVDAVLSLTPHPPSRDAATEPTMFTKGIWQTMNVPIQQYADSLLDKARKRNGSVPITDALQTFNALQKTPFASLYGMAAWFEDLAELLTIYHITQKLGQPYEVIVKKNNTVLARFEPMKNPLVKQRLAQLGLFYQ